MASLNTTHNTQHNAAQNASEEIGVSRHGNWLFRRPLINHYFHIASSK